LFLGLAHRCVGEVREARRRLNDAARGIAEMVSQECKQDLGRDWHIRAACQSLYCEAETLVRGRAKTLTGEGLGATRDDVLRAGPRS